MDQLGINEAFLDLNAAWMRDAEGLLAQCQSLNNAMKLAGEVVSEHMRDASSHASESGSDTLLHWVNNLAWSSRHYHQVLSHWLTGYISQAPNLDDDARQRAMFWFRQIIEMLTPANFFWTNPKAVQKFIKSNGESLLQGMRSWLGDVGRGDGLLELADHAAFRVGENLAVTPGQVVYRNQLVEIIQYAPQTPSTWQVPIVLIQPWINKYYVFDLSPQNSFVQYLVRQGFSVFITSWKNPTETMRHITFEDYMFQGALKAVTVARDICKSPQVHATGYCIGGTLLAALAGWLAHEKTDQPLADVTLFATLLDFAEPGDLKAFVNQHSLKVIEKMVDTDGVLRSRHMSLAFRLLNPGDLIWRYVVNNYFYGEPPPRSDMLFWNSDSTNLPGAMCLFYLKTFYLENRMVRPDDLKLGRRTISLKRVRIPIYAVGAQTDHICPWPATFQTCRLTEGKVRYILAGDGHITGIVNPPSPWSKKKYWAGAATRRRDAVRWLSDRTPETGSWWPDWISWLRLRSGVKVDPPLMGSKAYPALDPAPGTYVQES